MADGKVYVMVRLAWEDTPPFAAFDSEETARRWGRENGVKWAKNGDIVKVTGDIWEHYALVEVPFHVKQEHVESHMSDGLRALWDVSRGTVKGLPCWCGRAVGNPTAKFHTAACLKARDMFRPTESRETGAVHG